MILTVRIDDDINILLEDITRSFKKTKSEIVREALNNYLKEIKHNKEEKIKKAIDKCAKKDMKVYRDFEGILDENL
ncbi:ribbon-helix-helix protein, CopG family [Nitrosophilus labii]|uniref:ribbon-helix-helix protein, CopG family n=1 Tax=Nitrosophilus labii TaxID=2706014 RepID=UPI001656D33B|nr:ribbon-helix-helix protein, CopG family [Nitrosophilus labii]